MPKARSAAQKAASRRNLQRARAARKSANKSTGRADKLNGSGTGYTSAYRYLGGVQAKLKKGLT